MSSVTEFFNKLDKSVKFYITEEEISDFVHVLQIFPKYTTRLIDSMFSDADLDRDGKITAFDIFNRIIPIKIKIRVKLLFIQTNNGYYYSYQSKKHSNDWITLIRLAVKDPDHIFIVDHNRFTPEPIFTQYEIISNNYKSPKNSLPHNLEIEPIIEDDGKKQWNFNKKVRLILTRQLSPISYISPNNLNKNAYIRTDSKKFIPNNSKSESNLNNFESLTQKQDFYDFRKAETRETGKPNISINLVLSKAIDDKIKAAKIKSEYRDRYTVHSSNIVRDYDTNYSFGGPELSHTSYLDKAIKINQIPRGPMDPEVPIRTTSKPFKVLHTPIRRDIQINGKRLSSLNIGINHIYKLRQSNEQKNDFKRYFRPLKPLDITQ